MLCFQFDHKYSITPNNIFKQKFELRCTYLICPIVTQYSDSHCLLYKFFSHVCMYVCYVPLYCHQFGVY